MALAEADFAIRPSGIRFFLPKEGAVIVCAATHPDWLPTL